MSRFRDVRTEELRSALERVEGKRPTMRLVAGIAYKNGVSQTALARWFDVERKTVYNWLRRLEADDLVASVTDASRSGRRRKLNEAQLRAFRETVREPPQVSGIDADTWTPALVRNHLRDAYDVEYSLPSCRRLMREAGLRYHSRGEAPGAERRNERELRQGANGVWIPSAQPS